MSEDVNKLLDVIENLIDKTNINDPKEVNELSAIADRLDTLTKDLRDLTESKK